MPFLFENRYHKRSNVKRYNKNWARTEISIVRINLAGFVNLLELLNPAIACR